MYAYCANNPVIHQDSAGYAVETVFDIISLGASLVEVAVNPTDPWAWLGLVGDIADVAIPCVGGLGEAVDVLKAMNVIDKSVDVVQITKNTLEVISTTAHTVSAVGSQFVYTSNIPGQNGVLEYVGITNDFGRRKKEWESKREIFEYVTDLDRDTARLVEQTVITLFGRNGNTLSNVRNSIGKNGRLYGEFIDFFKTFF